MKKRFVIGIFAIAIIVIVASRVYQSMEENLEGLKNETIEDVNLSLAADGTYYGKYGTFPVIAEVKVVILNHEITEVEITRHDNGQGAGAEILPSQVIAQQSIELEVISGATYSSITILKAIEDALHDAVQG